ncbi:MAG TPA: DUF2252 domain-containing protein [Solirubrobacteraceae bacterium]|nr:DUF2252 domain-containing protein [Solirubrobacteraceae bacterium]
MFDTSARGARSDRDDRFELGRSQWSVDEQRSAGRDLRREVSRREHAGWSRAQDRADPVAVLEGEERDRVRELLPIRHARMAASPFAFLRGSAAVMAADLATTPSTNIIVQSCGDCHLSNFGVFATPERRLVFDINDFDETFPAPFEWDLKRLAASFAVAARGRGLNDSQAEAAVRACVRHYRERTLANARLSTLDVWYQSIPVEAVLEVLLPGAGRSERKKTEKALGKAQSRTNLGALRRFAEKTNDGWRIKPEPPLIVAYERRQGVQTELERLFEEYTGTLSPEHRALFERYRLTDFARKVVGVGSVGTEAFMFLFMGPGDDDPLFLQLKQAGRSVLAPFVDAPEVMHEGRRVVDGQRMMQAASDVFLGWARGGPDGEQDFYLRQLRDMKGSAEIETMSGREFGVYAALCGAALARAHSRSGQTATITGYLGKSDAFDRAIARFALDYAAQTERDHHTFTEAIAAGRLEVPAGSPPGGW